MFFLISGPARSGKSEHIFRQMRALAAAQKPSLLIVPESHSHQAERRMLEVCGNPGGRFAAVATFSKLARDVLLEAGRMPETLDAGGRVVHMYRALSESRSALRHYRGAPRPQLIVRLLETLDEMTAGGVRPQQLLEAAQAEKLGDKFYDLGLILSAYAHRVQAGGLEPRDLFDLACELLPASRRLEGLHVFIDGFSGFTRQRRRAIDCFLARCPGVTVALMRDADRLLFTQQEKTRGQLLDAARRAAVPARELELEPRPPAPLLELSRAVFDYGRPAPGDAEGRVALYACANPMEECELAAALVRQEVLAGGRARRVALVCADMAAYGPLLENAFARYQVPLFASLPEDILQKPPLIAVWGAAAALDSGLAAEAVLGWLKSGLSGVGRRERDKLENYALLWNLRGGAWLRPFTLSTTGYGNPAPDEAERLAELEAIRARALGPLEALRQRLAACHTGGEYARAMAGHLADTGFRASLEAEQAELEQAGQPRLALQYVQLGGIVQGALAQLESALNDTPMDRGDFTRLLRLTLAQYAVDTIPASLDAAVACTFERLPMGGVDHVLILGAREGLLPAAPAGGGLLSERERIALEGAGITLTQSAEERAFEAQSEIYRALAWGERLSVLIPQSDGAGEPCRPSHIARRIAALSGRVPEPADRLLDTLRLSAPIPALEAACRAGAQPEDRAARAAREHLAQKPGAAAFFARLEAWAQNPRRPLRSRELARGLYGESLPMTASRVEQLAACRFSYFMQYGLRAAPRREARFGPPEIGTFVHEVVEGTIRDLCEDPSADLRALARGRIDAFWGQAFANKAVTARLAGIFEALTQSVLCIVENIWEEITAGRFRPLWFEMEFGERGELPAMTVEAGAGRAQIRGKIDRVDGWIDGGTLYLKVVDYKTGKKAFRLSDVYYGLNLQMFLYLSLLETGGRELLLDRARAVLGGTADVLAPGGALYVPARAPYVEAEPDRPAEEIGRALDKAARRLGVVSSEPRVLQALESREDGQFRFLPVSLRRGDGAPTAASSVANAEQMGALIRHTRRMVGQLAAAIAGGDISANPYRAGQDATACGWCDFRPACQFDPTAGGDRYRYLPPLSHGETLEKITREVDQDGR